MSKALVPLSQVIPTVQLPRAGSPQAHVQSLTGQSNWPSGAPTKNVVEAPLPPLCAVGHVAREEAHCSFVLQREPRDALLCGALSPFDQDPEQTAPSVAVVI